MDFKEKRRLNALGMDYLSRSVRASRRDKLTNENIRRRMKAPDTIVDRIKRRGFSWFGQLLRMMEQRWLSKVFEWKQPGKINGDDQD